MEAKAWILVAIVIVVYVMFLPWLTRRSFKARHDLAMKTALRVMKWRRPLHERLRELEEHRREIPFPRS